MWKLRFLEDNIKFSIVWELSLNILKKYMIIFRLIKIQIKLLFGINILYSEDKNIVKSNLIKLLVIFIYFS